MRVTRSCWVSSGCKISTVSRRNITCFGSRELYLSVRCLHLNLTTVTVSREQRGNDLSKKNWEFAAPDNLYFTFSGQNLSGLSLACVLYTIKQFRDNFEILPAQKNITLKLKFRIIKLIYSVWKNTLLVREEEIASCLLLKAIESSDDVYDYKIEINSLTLIHQCQ